jgi:hypothetical protein
MAQLTQADVEALITAALTPVQRDLADAQWLQWYHHHHLDDNAFEKEDKEDNSIFLSTEENMNTWQCYDNNNISYNDFSFHVTPALWEDIDLLDNLDVELQGPKFFHWMK